jgi:hypothetical protein
MFRGCGIPGELLARTLDGKALIVEKPLDLEHGLNILAAVETVSGAALDGLESGELGFPVTKDIGLGLGQLADFPDAKVEFVRNGNIGQR